MVDHVLQDLYVRTTYQNAGIARRQIRKVRRGITPVLLPRVGEESRFRKRYSGKAFLSRVCVRVQVVDDRSVGRDRKPCVDHPRCTRFTLSHQQRPPRAFRLLSVRGVISSGRPAFRFQTVRVLFRVPRRRFVRRHLTRILLNKKNTCDSLYYRLSVWRKKKINNENSKLCLKMRIFEIPDRPPCARSFPKQKKKNVSAICCRVRQL